MNRITDLNIPGNRVLVRVDFNVPLNDNMEVTDDTRIKGALPTIEYILDNGGSVVLMSHLGRPDGKEAKYSLLPVASELSKLLGREVQFASDATSQEAYQMSEALKPGEILLLNNLRYYPEEKKGDQEFAKQLAKHGDMYVNDAFGTAHRAHASTAVIAQYFDDDHKAMGNLMAKEIDNAQKLLNNPPRPFVTITGGAKVSDKIQILQNLIGKADTILIGGGMAYTFIKALGGKIGNSLCEEDKLDLARQLIQQAKEKGTELILPEDSIIADNFSETANHKVSPSDNIPDGWMGLDIGPEASKKYSNTISFAKAILWNGPMGVFEMKPYAHGTETVAEAVAKATQNGAYSLIGGGDSAAAVNSLGFGDQVSYVSTGGGALLELFEGKDLPGVKALT